LYSLFRYKSLASHGEWRKERQVELTFSDKRNCCLLNLKRVDAINYNKGIAFNNEDLRLYLSNENHSLYRIDCYFFILQLIDWGTRVK
jgi:hypothetical protein